jgi:hypothetical protein
MRAARRCVPGSGAVADTLRVSDADGSALTPYQSVDKAIAISQRRLPWVDA